MVISQEYVMILMMLCDEQYPSLHLENKTRARGGRGGLQTATLFVYDQHCPQLGVVSDDDDYNDTYDNIDRYD